MKTEEMVLVAKCIRDAQLPIPMCHALTRDLARRLRDYNQFFDRKRFLLLANTRADPARQDQAPPVNWQLRASVEELYVEFLDWLEEKNKRT
jgi:hypothetical protein